MRIDGHTQAFAVLGHPVRHTLSPVMHNAALAHTGRNATYMAYDVHPDRVLSTLAAMADMGFVGANLTVPLKEVAFAGIRDLDPAAAVARAVNTVQFTSQGLRGYNTDEYGFLQAFEEAFGVSIRDRAVCILGGGGSSRAVALACIRHGARAVCVAGRRREQVQRLADEIGTASPDARIAVALQDDGGWTRASREADVIVNATPVGMKPGDPPPLHASDFRAGQMALDLIYVQRETVFTAEARKGGARAANGLGMLLHQGARAFEIWTGEKAPVDVMRAALEQAAYPR